MPYRGLPRNCDCGASPPPWEFVRQLPGHAAVFLRCRNCGRQKLSRGRAARKLAREHREAAEAATGERDAQSQ